MADLTPYFDGPVLALKPEQLSIEEQLIRAISHTDLEAPDKVIIDGKIHRFNSSGKRGDKSGWYIVYPDNIPAGAFGDWRNGSNYRWCAELGRELDLGEKVARDKKYEAARIAREADRLKMAEMTSETVSIIWENCAPASEEHPYLKRKGVLPHGTRVSGDGRLVLPLYDAAGVISTLQYIAPDGEKRYHTGGSTAGKYWTIGDIGKTIYIAEGFATGASIYEAVNQGVIIAYSAGNLMSVTGLVREKYGTDQDIVIVADNDVSGVGLRDANKAAERWNARVVMPPDVGDANDYVQGGKDLVGLLVPQLHDWLIPADEFCKEPSPIRWQIRNWVQDQALQMVHGPSGAGKSFLVLDWCLHIASGLYAWGGCEVEEGTVVYLAGEGHHGLKGRVAAWKLHHGIENLSMWLSRDGCDLNKPCGKQLIIDHIRALPKKPNLIVVDTLHRFLMGDENSAQDAREMLDACADLMREFSCTVILIHHTGLSEEAQHRARGSSAWKGALDIEVSVAGSGEGKPIQIIQRKSKDAEITSPVWVELQRVEIPGWKDQYGDPVGSAVVVPCDAPPESKKTSKIDGFKKLFERAWFASERGMSNGSPFISRENMIKFLVENDGNSIGTAKNMVKPSSLDKPIGGLINGGIIEPFLDGWQVKDNTLASILMLSISK